MRREASTSSSRKISNDDQHDIGDKFSSGACVATSAKFCLDSTNVELFQTEKFLFNFYSRARAETAFIADEILTRRCYLDNGKIKLPEAGTVVDVGANIGIFWVFAAEYGQDVHVLAIEPLPPNFALLKDNISLNGLDGRIEALQIALGLPQKPHTQCLREQRPQQEGASLATGISHPGIKSAKEFMKSQDKDTAVLSSTHVADFTFYPLMPGNSTMYPGEKLELQGHLMKRSFFDETVLFQCAVMPFSDLIIQRKIKHVDLLKVDVEGAELDVLRSVTSDHWQLIDQVVVECHNVKGRCRLVKELLVAQGFAVWSTVDEIFRQCQVELIFASRSGKRPACQ